MNKIIYKKGNIFDVQDPNAVLLHACNCKGVWGSGIAVDFKRLYPEAFKDYEKLCRIFKRKLLGKGMYFHTQKDGKMHQKIAYLFTSFDYGDHKDAEKKILINTEKALHWMLPMFVTCTEIHSPKINSGRFSVPWEKTEAVISRALKKFPKIKWTVWELPNAK